MEGNDLRLRSWRDFLAVVCNPYSRHVTPKTAQEMYRCCA